MSSEKYFPKLRKKNAERPMSAEQCVEFLQEKSLVAKLMAEDEITIQISGSSAYYNAETKTVNIPSMKDITPAMFEWFVAHEVSHSINTPSDWYHVKEEDAKVIPVGKKFHTYLNITEDARIEKSILSKYRGLKNLANKAVSEFLKIDLFGLNNIPMEQRRLSDRLNLHFKTHGALDVPFAEEEIRWVRAFENLESFDDVYDVAKALYEFEQENDTRLPQPEFEENEDDEEQDSESDDQDLQLDYDSMLSSDDEDEEEYDEESDEEEPQSQEEQTDQEPSGEQQGSAEFGESQTQENESFSSYEENMEQFLSNNNVVAKIETVEYVPHNASYVEHVIQPELDEVYRTAYGIFNKKFNSIIQNMVESFMRKKQSANYYRSSVSRTGVLNMEKIHEYRYNEDLFLSVVNNRDGDKYGVVFNLDYSGSMAHHILSTVEQTLVLAMFCKRVGIPFHVNLFHQEKPVSVFGEHKDRIADLEENRAYFIGDATNVKIIDEKTKKSDMVKAMGHLLLSAAWNNSYGNSSGESYLHSVDKELLYKIWNAPFSGLTGTPYNSSVIGLVQDVIPAVRKRCDKLVYINLTDGSPTDNLFYSYYKRNGEGRDNGAGRDLTTMVIKGKNASIPVSMRGYRSAGATDPLIRQHCDKFVEIYVCSNAQVRKYSVAANYRLGWNWTKGYDAVENKKSNGAILTSKDQENAGPDTYIIFCAQIKEAKEVEIKKTTASLASSLRRTVKASRHYKTIAQIYIDNIVA